ncbi:MAG: hypothetical protein HY934_06145 [Candidatus Firestonebacteria bacterium]|nr:hypothetical protein [Candidatus Firestonebacteria bacterium]
MKIFRACEKINWTNYRAGFLSEFKAHPQVNSRIKLFSKDATQKSGKKTSENVQVISSQALSIILLIFSISACAKINSDAPVTVEGRHSDEWIQKHKEKKLSFAIIDCIECHGKDFKGGISGTSCSLCHSETGVHPASWIDGHNKMAEKETNSCTECHGKDYTGGNSGVSCYTCHNGPEGQEHNDAWISQHAAKVKENNTSCPECHGADYKGGVVKVSCYKCHLGGENGYPHPMEWGIDSTSVFMSHKIEINSENYSNSSCALSYCHGSDLKGGVSTISWGIAPSCYSSTFDNKTCHTELPEADYYIK